MRRGLLRQSGGGEMPDGRSSNPKGDDLHEVDGWARKEPHFSKNQVQILTSPPRPRTFPEIEPYVLLLGARERAYHSCIPKYLRNGETP